MQCWQNILPAGELFLIVKIYVEMSKLLVIDAHNHDLTIIRDIVKGQIPQCEVLTATAGEEGIRLAQAMQPDAIILVEDLLVFESVGVCERLKSINETKHIPVILISSVEGDLNSEADLFIAKPVVPGELLSQIKILFRLKDAEDKLRGRSEIPEQPVEIRIHELNRKNETLLKEIEESKKAQHNEEKTGKYYRAIIEKAPDGIVLLDGNANFKYISPAAKRIFGYEISALLDGDPGRFAHPDDLSLVEGHLEKLFEDPSYIPTLQFRFSDAKGEWRWIECTISNLLADPNVEGIVVNFHDITKNKIVEDELTENEKRFRSFTNLLPQIVYETDEQGNLIYVNKLGLEEFGYPEEDLKNGLNIIQGFAEKDRERAKTIMANLLEGKNPDNREYLARRKDGSTFPCLIYSRIKYKNNLPDGMQGVIVNITSRKREEELIRESEQKLRLMIQNSPIGVSTTDLDGIFLEVNQALCKIVGYPKEEMLGFHYNKFSHPDDKEKNAQLFSDLVAGKISFFDLEKRYVRKDGKVVYARIRAQLIRNELGKPLFQTAIIEDITGQKETEEKLIKQEAWIRSIFRSAPVGIGVVVNRVIKQVNNCLCDITGYTPDELHNQSARILYTTEEEFDRVGELKYKDILSIGTGTIETQFQRKDGKIIDILLSSTPIKADDWSAGITFTALDITERKKAEKSLRENEHKLRNIFENSTSLFYSHTPTHIITDISPQVYNILGYTQEDAMISWTNLISDNPLNNIGIESTQKAIDTGERQPLYELELVKKDGTKIWVEVREFPLVENGKTTAIVGSLVEITERKKAEQIQKVLYNISQAAITSRNIEELIIKIQEFLGAIIDTRNFYIAFYDKETDSFTSPIIIDEKDDLNTWPAKKSLSGYVVSTRKPLLATKEEVLEMNAAGEIDLIGVLSEVWLGVPLISEGEATGIFAVQSYTNANAFSVKDLEILEFVGTQISRTLERKNSEQNLLNALKKANESDRLKSAFLATMSHELRTPLNAIIGFSEFLDESIQGAEVKKFGEIINSSGNHLLSIVNDLFDITLIESGETMLRKDTVNLKSLFNDVKNIIEVKLNRDGKTDVAFYVDLPKEIENFQLIIDSNKLKQILINLLKNAFKFTEEGSVTLGLKFESQGGKPLLKMNVTDTGIGIEKEKQGIIFDIFRQVEESTARRYGGTGIGLSVAKRLTEILGGKIWIESEIGKGSTFFVSIPYEEVKILTPKTEDLYPGGQNKNKTTILIAEDDEPSFYLIKVVLERLGMEIIWAKNGEDAVSYCKENDRIQLVFMDINMPVLNGYDATRQIKSFRPNLPVIAQTAYAVAGDAEKSLQAGCDDYISKPIKQAILLEKINFFLELEN